MKLKSEYTLAIFMWLWIIGWSVAIYLESQEQKDKIVKIEG